MPEGDGQVRKGDERAMSEIGEWTNPGATKRCFVRSALILAGSILAIAAPLCLLSIAMEQSGLSGPAGVAIAAAVCLVAGWASDGVAAIVHRTVSPLAAMLVGMSLRLMPPLVVCMLLALRGDGREYLPFVVYLLTFYLVTLALDTWWAVKRVSGAAVRPQSR
jgi:hypothetical protein